MSVAVLALNTYVTDREGALRNTGADRATPTFQGSDGSYKVNTFYDFDFMCFDLLLPSILSFQRHSSLF